MKLNFCFAAALAAVSLTQFASAEIAGQIDTFQDWTDGWFAGALGIGAVPPYPPEFVPDGGPGGAGDGYLQITGLGDGFSAGSRIVAINMSQWAGNYLNAGISGIGMDLKNFGTSDLTIRFLFEDPIPIPDGSGFFLPPDNEAVTTFGLALPAGSGWMHGFFAISSASMTVLGIGDVNTLLGHTTQIRIIDSPTPTDAVPIAGVLGVDNISAVAVPEPATWLQLFGALGWLVLRRRR
jgi:hypothetical protein